LPPLAGADRVDGFKNQTLAIDPAILLVNDTDPDGDALFISGVSPGTSQGGTGTLNCQSISYATAADFTGEDSVTYVLSDSRGGSRLGSVTVAVSANTAPVFAAIPDVLAHVLRPLSIGSVATDADVPANGLTYSVIAAPTNASIGANDGVFHWTPTRDQAPSTNAITLQVLDDGYPALSN